MTDDERPIAWLALRKGMAVVDSNGAEIGKLAGVLGDEQKDIFSGITWREGLLGAEHYVPADSIGELTAEAVHLTIGAGQARQEPPG